MDSSSNPYNTRSQAAGNLGQGQQDQDLSNQDFSNQQDISSQDYSNLGSNTQSYGGQGDNQGYGQDNTYGQQPDTTTGLGSGNQQRSWVQQQGGGGMMGTQSGHLPQQGGGGMMGTQSDQLPQQGGGGMMGTQSGQLPQQGSNLKHDQDSSLGDKVEGMLEKLANKISGHGPNAKSGDNEHK